MQDKEIERIHEVYNQRLTKPAIDYNPLLPQNYYLLNSREKKLSEMLGRFFGAELESIRVLDVGFGNGVDILSLIKFGVSPENIHGTEIRPERLEKVNRMVKVSLIRVDSFKLPFEDSSFDLLIQSTVFSSILEKSARKQLAAEMFRILKPGGKIFSYDLKLPNPWNRNVIKIDKKELKELFPSTEIKFYPATFNPVLARKIAGFSIIACEVMEKVPFLCSHYFAVIVKRDR